MDQIAFHQASRFMLKDYGDYCSFESRLKVGNLYDLSWYGGHCFKLTLNIVE
jgi:hypothetical protein